MKPLLWVCAFFGLLVAGCSTVDSRISKHRELFNTWPAAVQDKIVRGEIDIGFNTDQVRVALGEPDRMFTRTTVEAVHRFGATETAVLALVSALGWEWVRGAVEVERTAESGWAPVVVITRMRSWAWYSIHQGASPRSKRGIGKGLRPPVEMSPG